MDGILVKDKRLFERIATNLALRFMDLDGNKVGQGQACDVSAKGVGFISSEPLKPSTSLGIWLDIPDGSSDLYTQGSVAWSRPLVDGRYRIGVELMRPELMGFSRVLRLNQSFA